MQARAPTAMLPMINKVVLLPIMLPDQFNALNLSSTSAISAKASSPPPEHNSEHNPARPKLATPLLEPSRHKHKEEEANTAGQPQQSPARPLSSSSSPPSVCRSDSLSTGKTVSEIASSTTSTPATTTTSSTSSTSTTSTTSTTSGVCSSTYICYLLGAGDPIKRTYVGITVDLARRLRQHNGEIKGGAKATRPYKGEWRILGTVSGLVGRGPAQSFEWHVKHDRPKKRGVLPRIQRMQDLAAKWGLEYKPWEE